MGPCDPWAMTDRQAIDAAHREAVETGRDTYVDPDTGYSVFTESFLAARGYCCESRCRHCPYGHDAVPNVAPDR